MSKPEILQIGELPAWDEDPLNSKYKMHRYFEAQDKDAFVKACAGNIKGVVTRGDLGIDASTINSLPNLEVIVVYGVGYDAVDIEAAKAKNVSVTNTPDVLTADVADFAILAMLAQSRGLVGCEKWARDGNWIDNGMYALGSRVNGRKAGVLGLGRIGFEIAKRLAAFDIEIAYSDVSEKDYAKDWKFIKDPVELGEFADFYFVTLSASAATRHIVDTKVMDAVGPNGMVVNVSRAANIDELALLDALESKKLGSAAIDVFEGEPNINPRFLALDNCLLTPHHGSGTIETRKDMGQLLRDNLDAHFDGKPLLTPVISNSN
ncbi:MAG: 2-hydroxyacid dehydrogenase [Nitratireductor sp.]